MLIEDIVNECHPELLSLHSTNAFIDTVSASRAVMYSSHYTQHLITEHMDEKRVQTGVDVEMGKHTFSVKMPARGVVRKVIDRYPQDAGVDSIPFNPETLVIYEDLETKKIGCFSIPYHCTNHQYFGFPYKTTTAANEISPGKEFPKDTVFADSPAVKENGGYATGVEANILLNTHPAGSEDGVLIADDVLWKFATRVYETRIIECGDNSWPVNLYGKPGVYKPHPEIGEFIREDGILMATRSYNMDLMPVESSMVDVTEVQTTDKSVYVRGQGGRVVDVKVYRTDNDFSNTPEGVMNTPDKYVRAYRRYLKEIVDYEREIRNERRKKSISGKDGLELTEEFHALVVFAKGVLNEPTSRSNQRVKTLYRKAPVDEYRIEITVEYILMPSKGFKLTGYYGDRAQRG